MLCCVLQQFLDEGFPISRNFSYDPLYVFASKNFIDRAVRNFNTTCDQNRAKERLHAKNNVRKQMKKSLLDGHHEMLMIRYSINNFIKQIKYSNQIKKRITRRNRYWLEKLLPALQEHQNMFVAAGVAHFIKGPHGNRKYGKTLLDMLEEKGFEIKRYNTKCLAKKVIQKNDYRGEDR